METTRLMLPPNLYSERTNRGWPRYSQGELLVCYPRILVGGDINPQLVGTLPERAVLHRFAYVLERGPKRCWEHVEELLRAGRSYSTPVGRRHDVAQSTG